MGSIEDMAHELSTAEENSEQGATVNQSTKKVQNTEVLAHV